MKITTVLAMTPNGPDMLVAELNNAPGITGAAAVTEHGLTTITCDASTDGASLVRRIVQASGGIITQIAQ